MFSLQQETKLGSMLIIKPLRRQHLIQKDWNTFTSLCTSFII